jgi:hypothetical protein
LQNSNSNRKSRKRRFLKKLEELIFPIIEDQTEENNQKEEL